MGLPASVSWAPGRRLVTTSGASQFSEALSGEGVHPSYLRLFYQGHLQFRSQTSTTNPSIASIAYRSYLLELLRSLELSDNEESEREAGFVRDAFIVWGLVAGVYFDGEGEGEGVWIGGRMAEWWKVNWGGADVEGGIGEMDWWREVGLLVAVGDLGTAGVLIAELGDVKDVDGEQEVVGKILMGASEGAMVNDDEAIVVVGELLKSCPGFGEGVRLDGSWDAWQGQCAEWAENLGDDCKGEKLLLGVMAGNVEALKDVCTDWQSLFVAYLIYVVGGGRYGDSLGYVSKACAYAAEVHGPPEHIAGGALTEAALGNPEECIIFMGSAVGTAWHAAHLATLLAPMFENCRPLKNHYISLFATGLEWHPGLWRIAVDYLLAIEDTLTLTEFLSRVNITSTADPKADKLLCICKQHGFRDVENRTYRRLARLALANTSIGGAVYYNAKAGDIEEAIQLCLDAASNAELHGPQSQEAQRLKELPPAILASQNETLASRVHWISMFVDLQKAMKEQHIHGIVQYGAQLLDAGGLPQRFWKGVLGKICSVIDQAEIDTQEAQGLVGLLSKLEIADVDGSQKIDVAIAGMRKTLMATFVRGILQ